jgi:DNA replication protein DnaC
LRLAELELIDRERHMVERRIRAAHFSAVKRFDTFDFTAIPSLNKPFILVSIALPRSVRESDCSVSSC